MRFSPSHVRYSGATILAALVLAGLAACEQKPSAPPPPPTPEVGIITVSTTPVPVFSDLPGRTNAFLVAQVRARVDGIVQTLRPTSPRSTAPRPRSPARRPTW
jgi:multidrug efflux pump subunit AcrA (membrane-fusion protein)